MSLLPALFTSPFSNADATKFGPTHWNRAVTLLNAVFDGADATGTLLARDTTDTTDGVAWTASPALTSLSLASGSAATPSLLWTDAGVYRTQANNLGFSLAGKLAGFIGYRVLNGSDDNTRLVLGTTQNITTASGATRYLSTISPANPLNQTGNCAAVGVNIGRFDLVATDTVQRTHQFANIEADKIVISQTGGAVLFDWFQNTNFRVAVPTTGVTITDNVGINFLMPDVGEVTGAVTNYKAINIPTMSGAGGTNFYGIFFQDTPANGSIAAASNKDLTLNAGGTGRVWVSNNTGGLAIGQTARLKTLVNTLSSPIDAFVLTSNGNSSGWQGAVDLSVSYSAGTAVRGLRVLANTDGTTASVIVNSAFLHKSSITLTNGAAALTATLTNSPVTGNPTKWVPIDDNGTTRYVPCW